METPGHFSTVINNQIASGNPGAIQGDVMRRFLAVLSMMGMAYSGVAKAQNAPGIVETFQGKGGTSLDVTSVLLFGGCKVILPGSDWSDEQYRTFLYERSSWSGPCDAHGLADGDGALIVCEQTHYNDKDINCLRYDGVITKGLFQGKVAIKYAVHPNASFQNSYQSSGTYRNGCANPELCDAADALRIQARYLASRASMNPTANPTGGTVGQNRGKGGNPDWIYDDADHGKCVSVESAGSNTGSKMAYGHYKLVNRCAYPVKLRKCITPDRQDGNNSNYDLHQDGAKCPGMGWLGSALDANETADGKEWFEYNRLKWDIQICREGWDFIGADDRYPSDVLGETYGCRKRRS